MLAARYWAPRDLRLENAETPVPEEGEVVIKVLASNICGTDLKSFLRGHPLMRPPMTMGHEFCGVVSEVGDGVEKFKPGDRVVASNSSPCGTCAFCRLGAPTLCEKIPSRLIGFSIPGSYAQYLRIPRHIVSDNAYSVKTSVSPEEMACSEPLAAAIHALDRVKLESGMSVFLIGSGALGLMLLQLLKTKGIHVTMTNRSESRLRTAEKLGADEVLRVTDEDLVAKAKGAGGPTGPDLVIEAVGKKETWEAAFRIVREGGQVLLFGGCAAGTEVSFDAGKMHYGEVTVTGSFHHEPSSFKRAITAIESGKVRVRPLLTHSVPLQRIQDGFGLMERREALKVTVTT
jgi:L-iditol 2-dehydrogenase